MVATSIWDAVREAARQPDRGGLRLWEWLKEKIALAQYRPEPAPGVIASHLTGREGDYHILKNPRTKTYYRLSDRDYFLWQRMDGTQTVKELVVAYFLEYGSFAFGRAASLVAGLKANLLLSEQPVDVYRQVRSRLQRRRLSYRLSQVWQAFLQMQFSIRGLDRVIHGVYRWGGRLFFTWPLQALFLIVTAVGLYLFVRLFGAADYGVLTIGGSYRLGVIGLIGANLASILIHEMSHALTVKHYGREVRRGGFMLYFGMPAFFVDTMDIWMEGKRARLAVTWAGPYSGLVLGGLVSIVMTAWPAFALNALLFQFAFLCYLTVFFNLNPLLELDGYFILMDWLEIPMLRQKSLAFIRRGFWQKLKDLRESGSRLRDTLDSFSREERIFAVFGALSAIWTAYAIFSGTRFWQRRLAGAVGDLWAQGGGVGKTILALVIAAISLLFVVSIGMALLGIVRKAVDWLAKQAVFAVIRNVGAILLVAAVAIALVPRYVDYPALVPLLSVAALATAVVLAWRNGVNYAGSRLAVAFWLLAISAAALVPSLVLGAAETAAGRHLLSSEMARIFTASLGHVAYASLLASGLVLFADTDLSELATPTKALLALGLLVSYGLVLLVAQGRAGETVFGIEWLLDVSRALFPLLALILLLPTLFSFWETSFGPAWATISLALGAHIVGSLLGWSLLSSYLLLATGLFLHHLSYTQVTLPEGQPETDLTLSDWRRLERAFDWTVTSVFGQFRQIAGERRARLLAEQFNNFALAAGWRLSLVHGRVDDALRDRNLIEQGARYADVLSLLLDMVAQEVGEKLTVRALQRAYDSLPWEEREIGVLYLFRDVKRAEALSQAFQTTREDHRGLLRRNPLFATMDEAEIDLLVSRLSVERYASGGMIIRQGDAGDTFYIVKRGHVEVTQRDERGVSEVVNQLDRGDYFGELALLHDAPRNATCRATVPTEVLCLSRPDFDRLVRARFSLREKVDRSIARAQLLCRMPLFAELDAHQIQLIAAQLREEFYEAGGVIIRQGEIGDTFYVIESGRVRVSVEEDDKEHVVAERGRGEYAGEIALLLDVPRTATVTALTDTRVLTLHKDDFSRLVTEHLYVSRGLERETSRRMIDLERAAMAV
jgi:putative peptide zinc metalloprotease protein